MDVCQWHTNQLIDFVALIDKPYNGVADSL